MPKKSSLSDPFTSNITNTTSLIESLISPDNLSFLPVVHVAGTKGKGSTCLLIASLLQKHLKKSDVKIGLYTSPHLRCITERIQINKVPIDKDTFSSFYYFILRNCGSNIFLFQLLTILGILYFYTSKIDIAVIETGIGGTLDPTNIFSSPLATVITSIGWDHTDILGLALVRSKLFLGIVVE